MNEICNDNRFELIDEYKQKLIEGTNIETSTDEMAVIDNILFRFWQMGWLEELERMVLVKESAKTLMNRRGDSIYSKVLRNAGRFVQNAIDGEAPDFENVPTIEPNKWIPCNEKLPEEDVDVLITYRYRDGEGDTKHRYVDITNYGDMYFGGNKVGDAKHWRQPFPYFTQNYEVIAWMPLPEPYKGGE